jgi:hypothetical protein
MASSISSERTFSSAGITISKCCSHLKGDIVKALQCLKCMLQHELISREPEPCSTLETGLDDKEELQRDNDADPAWDEIFLADDEADDIETGL